MEEEYEVVISGVGGKFPEADQIDELKVKLMNKENLVTVNDRRWQIGLNGIPPAMGKVRDVEKFDTTFFGIHRRLSNFMDPQNRHLLERSYEALYDSGYNPNSLKGSNIGVFVAAALNETEYYLINQKIQDGFGILGLSRAMMPNRISYFFNFKGPSTVVQNGWECGLEVLTIAARKIKEGRIDAALVGVPNLHMFSQVSLNAATMGCLTFDDTTKSFDADAEGYVQSEAVVMLFLQRKADARRVYATVVHSDSCVCGARLTPFTQYSEEPIILFLKEFYENCKVDPSTVSFVEADGSAVIKKDLTELIALSKVIGRDEEAGLLVGSVKSNIGHAEAASSLVGLVKALIALDSGTIPSNISFKKLHPLVSNKVKVVSEHTQLSGDLVAVNGLSFTGGMGHALLKQNPKKKGKSYEKHVQLPRLVIISARNSNGAEFVLNKISSMQLDYEFISLVNDIHLLDIPGHMYRTYVVHQGDNGKHITEYKEVQSKKPPVWFVFSGMGSQWPTMGHELLKIKVFAESIAKCDRILAPKGINIYSILSDNNPKLFDNILNCFVGIACMQVALVDLLFAIGIKPDGGIIGHSVGELGCAYADGCFTAEQMILASYARGCASVETELILGAMAAVGLGYKDMKDRLPPGIEVACHNSSESCTISGPKEDIKTFVDCLTKEGIFARMVKSADIAYHSKYIAPAAPKLLSYLKEVIPESKPRSSKWISTSVPYNKWNTQMARYSSPEYHTNNLLSAVLFEEACKHIPSNAICIEIAPHGLLQAIIRRSLNSCIHIPMTLRNVPCPVTFLLSAIGKMYLNNLQPNANALHPKVDYPVSRGTPSLASLVTWDHSEDWPYGEKHRTIYSSHEEKLDFDLQNKKYKEISAYKIYDNVTIPVFALLYFVWEKLIKATGKNFSETPVVFEDVWVHEMIIVNQFSSVALFVSVQQTSGQFEVTVIDQDTDEAKPLISGNCSVLPDDFIDPEKEFLQTSFQLDSTYLHIPPTDLYDIFSTHGLSFMGNFRNIRGLFIGDKEIVCKIEWNNSWIAFFEGLVQVATFFQLKSCPEQTSCVPLHIQKLKINPKEFLLYSLKKEVKVCLDSVLNTIFCDGIELMGLSFKSIVNEKSTSELFVQSPIFIPHGTTQFKSVHEFLSACIQIVKNNKLEACGSLLGNFSELPPLNILLVENCNEQFLYKKELHQNAEVLLTASLSQLTDIGNKFYLTVITEEAMSQSVNIKLADGFFLVQTSSHFVPDRHNIFFDFSTVLHQKFDSVHLTLVKKKLDKDIYSIEGIGLSRVELLSQIKMALESNIAENKVVVVVQNKISLLSSVSFIQKIIKEYFSSEIRFVFILGEPSCIVNTALISFENQLKEGLLVNYYKDGVWGSVIMVDSLDNKVDEIVPILTACDKEIEFKYMGLNKSDFNYGSPLKTKSSLGPLEFSGVLNKTEKIMGFASWDSVQAKSDLILDNEYVWQVPDSWSLEDAATVPFSFALAYYSLKLLMKLKSYESVLIHSGFSTVGQAAITVALQIGSTVYTTHNTEKQKQQILSQFPVLNADRVLQLKNYWFEDQILSLSSGHGVNVIFSTLAGESFNASLRCLSTSGRFLQLNKADMELGHNMGMSFFLRNTSLYAFDVDHIFTAPSEWKKVINASVKKGIENGSIKPLKRQTYQLSSEYDQAVREILNTDGDFKILFSVEDKSKQIIRKPAIDKRNKAFIVVGSGSGLWLDILQILAKKSANNLIMVFNTDHSICGSQSHKINKLISLHNTTIQTSSIYQLNSIQSTEEFLRNILKFFSVDSIFITLTEKEKYCISNLDVACRKLIPDVKFICLMGIGEDICESRLNSGLHALAVIPSFQNFHQRSVIPLIETVCSHTSLNNIFVVSQSSIDKVDDNNLFEDYLPRSLSDLEILSFSLQDKFSFTEVNSKTPHLTDLQFATPVFVLPGLTIDNVTPLVLQLMAPVFCAVFPTEIESVTVAAKQLIVPLLHIQPSGPFNIVGETWNGGIALELARLLEESGHTVTLILLNAVPETFQNMARNLGSFDSFKFNKNILAILLNLKSEVLDEISGFPDNGPTWNDLISSLIKLKFSEIASEEDINLRGSLDAMHSRILAMLSYKNSPLKKSSVAMILSNNSFATGSNLNELYGDNVTAYLMEETNHSQMISSVKTADLINELINFVF